MSVKKTCYWYLKEFVRDMPDQFMIGYDNVWLTNTQVLERVESAAYFLRQQGVKKGDLVAISMSRSAHSTIAMLALMSIGALSVLCDPHQKVEDFLKESAVEIPAKYILTNEDTVRGLWDGEGMVFIHRATGERILMEVMELPSMACPEGDDVDPRDPAVIIFTSGSTGTPKGIVISHRAVIDFTEFDTRKISVSDFTINNLPKEYSYNISTKNLEVALIGDKNNLKDITDSDISCVIDASNLKGKTGSMQLPVDISIYDNNNCWIYGNYIINVNITEN